MGGADVAGARRALVVPRVHRHGRRDRRDEPRKAMAPQNVTELAAGDVVELL